MRLAIKPSAAAIRAVLRAGRVLVSISITFAPAGGTQRTIHATVTVTTQRKKYH